MTVITPTQSSLLARTLGRLRSMHQEPTAFVLGLALKANDCPLDLETIRKWLAAHKDDAPEEDPRGNKFTTKPTPESSTHQVPKSDAGVDEKQKEIPKMATESANVATGKTWFDFVDESTTGDYVKFQDGDEKVIKIVTNPLFGPIEFKQKDGSIKVNNGLKLTVLVDQNPAIKEWTITSGGLMQQLKAISIREGMGLDIAGSIFRVNVAGDGLQRKYFLKLLQKPGNGQTQARPAPIPVNDADREAACQARQAAQQMPASQPQAAPQTKPPFEAGADWIESQRAGMAAPGGR